MLVLPRVEAAEILLNDFGLLVEELALFLLHFILFLIGKLATADVASPYSLNFLSSFLFILVVPLNLEHALVLLDDDGGGVLFVPELLSLVDHVIVRVNQVFVPLFTFL